MSYAVNPASASTLGEVKKVSSTTSGSPDTIHTISTDNAKARVSLWVRNIHTAAVTVYFRVKDSGTTGDYQTYALPLASSSEVNLGYWLWQNELIKTNGTNNLDIQAYASVTNVVEYKLTSVEEA